MYHHIVMRYIDSEQIIKNKTREEVLVNYVCPFINREVTFHEDEIYNMAFPISVRVFYTELPITTDWPINIYDKYSDKSKEISNTKSDTLQKIDTYLTVIDYVDQIIKSLEESKSDITYEIYRDAILLLDDGKYKDLRRRLIEEKRERYAFFICPFGNDDIDRNYEFVIKPAFKAHLFNIERADEIASSGPVTEIITNAIIRSGIIVADLTEEKPNCYYEVGFAHSLGKPVILLAREGTIRHFDISVYQWHHWKNYEDLKPKLERALIGVLKEVGYIKTQNLTNSA